MDHQWWKESEFGTIGNASHQFSEDFPERVLVIVVQSLHFSKQLPQFGVEPV
jgi:hypothetical protein